MTNAKIVCATNFSLHANTAALTGARMAARLGSSLQLVHVIDPKRYRNVNADFMNDLRNAQRKKIVPLLKRIADRGVTAHASIIEGAPVRRIVEIGSEPNVRFVILAANGQIAPTQWLMGSVTDGVVRRASTPTLVLREAKSIEAWLKGERPLRILVGYDFSTSADAALAWSDSLREIGPIDLTVLYIARTINERARFRVAPTLSPFYYPSWLKRLLKGELQQATDASIGKNATTVCVKADWGRVDSQFIETATELQSDLVVTGTSGRRGLARLASFSRAVLHYAPTNVACVRSSAAGGCSHGDKQFPAIATAD